MTDDAIRIEIFLWHCELETRFRSVGRDLIGEGRTKRYAGNGRLIEDTGWVPTGIRLIAPPEEPSAPWWKFWG
jgi:hypothetical protein